MGARSIVTEGLTPGAVAAPARPAAPELRAGQQLGRYELVAPLASGGMAHVWVARQVGDHGFERLVAVKTIRPENDDESFRQMFLDEARIAARIRHANVVEVFDLGTSDGTVFQAMTLVEGDSLSGLFRRLEARGDGWVPPAIAVRIVADALAGLHAAHELTGNDGQPMHLVHRDVSPQNILLGLDGSVRIADFGIAKALGRGAAETDAGQMKGKLAYASPEQLRRQPLDRRSDVYAAGIVLWEAFAARALFVGVDMVDTVEKALAGHVPDPRKFVPALPAALARVALQALMRDPEDRYPTALAMSDALESAARDAGLTATTKDLAAFVAGLCGADVAARRADYRPRQAAPPVPRTQLLEPAAETPRTTGGVTKTLPLATPASPSAPPSARRSRTFATLGFVAAGLVLTAAGVASVASRHAKTPAAKAAIAPPAESVTSVAPGNDSAAPPPPPTPAPSSSSDVETASPSPPPPPRRSASPPSRTRPPVPAPKPRYANPYESK